MLDRRMRQVRHAIAIYQQLGHVLSVRSITHLSCQSSRYDTFIDPPRLSSCRFGTDNVSIAPVRATTATAHNAAVKDPVRVFIYANKYGDMNEEIFPIVLIIPTAAAAADWLRISVGMEKNTEIPAVPRATMVNNTIAFPTDCGPRASPIHPHTAISKGTAACHLLSRWRSECQPFTCIATKQAAKGSAPSSPSRRSETSAIRFNKVGNQNMKM